MPTLNDFLLREFNCMPSPGYQYNRLFICEMADAIVAEANIGHDFSRKWVFANGVLTKVPLDFAYKEMYATDESEKVYVSPSYLFAVDSDCILLSERYGHGLKRRRLGRIQHAEPSVQVEWETLWSSGVNGPTVTDYYNRTLGKNPILASSGGIIVPSRSEASI